MALLLIRPLAAVTHDHTFEAQSKDAFQIVDDLPLLFRCRARGYQNDSVSVDRCQ
jgi:hypothetical protein